MRVPTEEESIFDAAQQLGDAVARSEFLSRACGANAQLRQRVEALLSAYDSGAFLERPANGVAVTEVLQNFAERPGSTIGRYKLLEQIGEGGMGLVFMAEQSQPLRRRVALKIIKPGLDTRSVIARFEAERQALALMDHPNIARVYDAGATESGRPYFVMELVRGAPITHYCQQRKLDLRERLELFVEVCQAVQHAHQKGVIHRDLKPTNILVSQCDTAPVPKVIDFGVAKATVSQTLTDKTLFTNFSQIIGTPLYMSPEQADLGNQDIDTRSDVYSLGVVLYELLTGATPFDAERLRSVGRDEMRWIVREEEPPKPSTRATTAANVGTTAASPPWPRPPIAAASLKGDLDWIVMKALDKDRRRRYESPGALAADIKRFLAADTVEACPPTRRYRLAKFVRRNMAALLMFSAVASALLAGTAISVWQAMRATSAERAQRKALDQARLAVDEMYTKVAEKWLAEQGLLTEVQRELLESALAFYEGYSFEANADLDMQRAALGALFRVGRIQQRLGKSESAREAYLQVIDRTTRLSEQHPHVVHFVVERVLARIQIASVLRGTGLTEEANRHLAAALAEVEQIDPSEIREEKVRVGFAAALRDLAGQSTYTGRVKDAERVIQAALQAWQALVYEFPGEFAYRYGLANTYMSLGHAQMWWGSQDGKAEATLTEADTQLTALLQERPRDRKCRTDLVTALINLGVVQGWHLRNAEALETHRRAMQVAKTLADEFPHDIEIQDSYAKTLTNVSKSLAAGGAGQPDAVDELLLKALDVRERLVESNPERVDFAVDYLRAYQTAVAWALEQRKREVVEHLCERADTHLATIARHHGSHKDVEQLAAGHLVLVAGIYIEEGDHRSAAACLDKYPVGARRFRHDDIVLPDQLPERHYGMKLAAYNERAQMLLTPHELVKSCMRLAQSDSSLTSEQRTTLLSDYDALASEFRREGDLAVNAWLELLAAVGEDIGFRLACHGETLLADWLQFHGAHSSAGYLPENLRSAYCAVDRTIFRRLTDAAAIRWPDEPSLFWVALTLSCAPEELRDTEAALRMARRSVELAPSDPRAKLALACALYRAGMLDECVDANASAEGNLTQDIARNLVSRCLVSMALWKLERHDEARATLQGVESLFTQMEVKHAEAEARGMVSLPTVAAVKRLLAEAAAVVANDDREASGTEAESLGMVESPPGGGSAGN